MVKVEFDQHFKKIISKLKSHTIKERILKLILKIKENPDIGKPMKHNRKGTREVYLPPFRLSYAYNKTQNSIVLLDLYHKDEQ